MSIDYEHGEAREGEIYVPLRHRARPAFTTTEEAIAYVREVLAEIGPWPEKVEVTEAAALEGRLTAVSAVDHDPAAAKVHAIGAAVRSQLSYLEMAVRMPHLALVAGEYAEFLWGTRTFRVAGETVSPAAEVITGLLREAGRAGITVADLWGKFDQAVHAGAAPAISRAHFQECLRALQREDVAERDPAVGRWWRLPRQDEDAFPALPLVLGVSGKGKSPFTPAGGEGE